MKPSQSTTGDHTCGDKNSLPKFLAWVCTLHYHKNSVLFTKGTHVIPVL